jgi:hypothetical protein
MFDFSNLREAYQAMKTMAEPDKSRATTMFVMTAIAYTTYYIVAGVTIILLGRAPDPGVLRRVQGGTP